MAKTPVSKRLPVWREIALAVALLVAVGLVSFGVARYDFGAALIVAGAGLAAVSLFHLLEVG